MNKTFAFLLMFTYSFAFAQTKQNEKIPLFETKSLVNTLSSDELQGRKSGTEGYLQATKLVEAYLKNAGVQPFFYNSYSDSTTVNGEYSPNIVGYIKGKTDSVIVLGAHLDHIGVIEGKIHNGANDNASGVVAVLQIAKYLKTHLVEPENTIVFAFFTAEEFGLLGSRHYANVLKSLTPKTEYMLNFEMLGHKIYKKKTGNVYMVSMGRNQIQEEINKYLNEQMVLSMYNKVNDKIYRRSDNYSFHNTFGCPAVTFTNYNLSNYDQYHTHKDEFQKIDVKNLNVVINKLAKSIHFLLQNNIPIE